MRKSTLMALALASTTLVATPAAATADNAGYVGIEGGLWFPRDTNVEFEYLYDGINYDYDFDVEHEMGFDGDIIGGYDFGAFRAEAELGYKTADIDEIDFGDGVAESDVDGDLSVFSLMGNILWNPTMSGNWDAYLGGGIGWAWSEFDDDSSDSFKDNAFAWQLIAGVGYRLSENIELGLKYRYFETKFSDDFEEDFDTELVNFDVDGDVRSHSLLASLIFNFGAPAAPVVVAPPVVETPPPPPPPATQTCYDGSVILATDVCPQPPVETPPPPPEPTPERG